EARVGWRILAVRRLGRFTLARFWLKIAMHLLLIADGIYFHVERSPDGFILLGIDAAQEFLQLEHNDGIGYGGRAAAGPVIPRSSRRGQKDDHSALAESARDHQRVTVLDRLFQSFQARLQLLDFRIGPLPELFKVGLIRL